MKLKKILASLTAAVMAVTTMAFAPLSVSAETVDKPDGSETVLGTFTLNAADANPMAQYGSIWVDLYSLDESVFDDANNYVKVTFGYDVAPTIGDGNDLMSTVASWGFGSYSWYNVGQFYETTSGTIKANQNLRPATNSTDTEFYCYLPVSDFTAGDHISGNVQNFLAQDATLKSVQLVQIASNAPFEGSVIKLPKNTYNGGWNWQGAQEVSTSDFTKDMPMDKVYDKASTIKVSFKINGATAGTNLDYDASQISWQINIKCYNSANDWPWIIGGTSTYENGIVTVTADLSSLLDAKYRTADYLFNSINLVPAAASDSAEDTINVYYQDMKVSLEKTVPATGIEVSPKTMELFVGDKDTVTATVTPANSTDTVVFSSDKPDVASVGAASGEVTALAEGTAVITAKANDTVFASCTVTVKKQTIPVTSIKVTPETATLKVGQTTDLKAEVTPTDATDPTVNWESSNTDVATVDKNGTVTALAAGKVTITASSVSDPAITDTCDITVEVPVKSVTVTPKTATIKVGKTTDLKAEVTPTDATVNTVTWSSSDETVAAVDQNGTVTAKAAGTATITAVSDDNNTISDSCEVTVEKNTYAVTVKSNNDAYGSASAGVDEAAEGDVVGLTYTAAKGYKFSKWESDDVIVAEDNTFKMPANAVTVTAVFEELPPDEFAVNIAKTVNGKVSVKGGVTSARKDTVIEVVVTPDKGYELDTIKVNGEAITGTSFTMPDNDVTIEVTFKKISYTVTVKAGENGKASVDKATAQMGDTVTVTATPDANYELAQIVVNGKAITGNTFVMPAENVTVEVTFNKYIYAVTVKAAENGTVTVDKTSAKVGETVTVTATPDADYELYQIIVNGKAISGNTFVMTAEDTTVTATFNKNVFTVTVKAAENGTVSVDKASAKVGETVTVTATPDKDYELSQIIVNGKAITGNTFTMPAENVTVTAEFKKVGSADAEVVTPDGVSVSFADSKEDILKAVFGDDYADLVAAGYKLDVIMTVKDETAVSADDKALIEGALSNDMHIGLLIDVSLVMTKDGVSTVVTSSNKPISFVIGVPDSIIADGRTYSVIRVHDGAATDIGGTYDAANKTITVSSDKYSTYAVVYKDAPAPEPVKPTYYSITADRNVTLAYATATAGTQINIRVEFGYDAYVYCGGKVITKITESGSFTMPAGNVTIATEANGYLVMIKNAAPNSYIFVYDADMNYIKTNGSVKGIKGEGKITVKLGEEYAGKTVTLYKGRKSTSVELETKTLDANGNATFTVEGGKNYTAVVE